MTFSAHLQWIGIWCKSQKLCTMFSYDSLCNSVLYVHEKTCYLIRVQAQVIRSFMLLIVPCHLITLLLKTAHVVEFLFLCVPDRSYQVLGEEWAEGEASGTTTPRTAPKSTGPDHPSKVCASQWAAARPIDSTCALAQGYKRASTPSSSLFSLRTIAVGGASMTLHHSLPALCVCASTDV